VKRGAWVLVVVVYLVLTVAALGRSGFQIATKFSEAPLAYSLSAFSAVVYLAATIALIRGGHRWNVVGWVTLTIELVGVLAVGAVSLNEPALFPDDTVWSAFGRGYLFIPLVLPAVGMFYLYTRSRKEART
jgi:cytochrome bd-type quinol oxidase subunit 2